MFNKPFSLFVTIKSRLYLSFFLLVLLFIINGVVTLVVLQKNKALSNHITQVVDPTTQALFEFNKILIESKMLSTNWVFIRSNKEDKEALLKIHTVRYPQIKVKLNELAPKLFDNAENIRLKQVFDDFDELIGIQKKIMTTLNSFESYDDAFIKMEIEMKVEDEIIPKTASLLSTMNGIMNDEKDIRTKAHINLDRSNLTLRYILMSLATWVIALGILLAIYLTSIITKPIKQLCEIINDMGKGKLKKIEYKEKHNEIGLMITSVNKLSCNLNASANFANEIGKRNFSSDFQPLSEDDILGKALITMRDNLKESDYLLNQAQSIAKLGSWEFDLNKNEIIWSDELYNILGYKPGQVKAGLVNFMEMVLEEDRPKFKEILNRGLNNDVFYIECKILAADNILKELYIQGQAELDVNKNVSKFLGIVQDITVQKQTEKTLLQNNIELQKTNKELDKFVYSVSHDLRAPLSSILGIVQLSEEECQDAFIKENLTLVKGSILKLDGFIQDILAYSRNSRLDVRQDEILFNELLTDMTGNLKHMGGAEGNVKIITNVLQLETCTFKSDKSRLNIVLNNLVSNAIRYHNPAQKEPFVKVDVKIKENEAQITVADNGIGIKKELHQKVFDMFYRVSENSVGSGLGLYIVKETVDKLKGDIQIESEPGVGTKFLITIPNL